MRRYPVARISITFSIDARGGAKSITDPTLSVSAARICFTYLALARVTSVNRKPLARLMTGGAASEHLASTFNLGRAEALNRQPMR